jgi:hypothetical protein
VIVVVAEKDLTVVENWVAVVVGVSVVVEVTYSIISI